VAGAAASEGGLAVCNLSMAAFALRLASARRRFVQFSEAPQKEPSALKGRRLDAPQLPPSGCPSRHPVQWSRSHADDEVLLIKFCHVTPPSPYALISPQLSFLQEAATSPTPHAPQSGMQQVRNRLIFTTG
jgi:hypothetical protein